MKNDMIGSFERKFPYFAVDQEGGMTLCDLRVAFKTGWFNNLLPSEDGSEREFDYSRNAYVGKPSEVPGVESATVVGILVNEQELDFNTAWSKFKQPTEEELEILIEAFHLNMPPNVKMDVCPRLADANGKMAELGFTIEADVIPRFSSGSDTVYYAIDNIRIDPSQPIKSYSQEPGGQISVTPVDYADAIERFPQLTQLSDGNIAVEITEQFDNLNHEQFYYTQPKIPFGLPRPELRKHKLKM